MSNNNSSGGIGFVGVLQILFIALKLCKVVTWAWPVVLLPIIICVGLGVLAVIVLIAIAVVKS